MSEPAVHEPGRELVAVEDRIGGIVLARRAPRAWIAGTVVGLVLLLGFLYGTTYLFAVGVGIWGVNAPVGWGFAIINFVWWIGIGHAGTLISAILLLLRQPWRTSINRLAEAMTLFAVACAATFPALHLGRPWLFYWLVPYPDTMGLWPQFRKLLDERTRAAMAEPPPMADRTRRPPPEPRLEVSPGAALRSLRAREDQILSSYGWVDRDAGVVRIPIERAMELVVPGRRAAGEGSR